MPEPVVLLFLAVLLAAVVGTPLVLRWERRRPSAYTRQPEVLAAWRSMSTEAQAAHDNAVLDAAEVAESAAARVHALYQS